MVNLILRPLRRLREVVDQPDGWQARHFAVAPFGGLLSTWLWVSYGPAWAQFDNFGVLFYGAVAVLLEGGYQVFYAISKRRRDINAAEARGRREALADARAAMFARLRDDPDADPMSVFDDLNAQSRSENGGTK